MVVDKLSIVLTLFFFINVSFCLPLNRESPEINRRIRSAPPHYPSLGHQDGPLLNQWDLTTMGEDDFTGNYFRNNLQRRFMEDHFLPLRDSTSDMHRRALEDQSYPHHDNDVQRKTLEYPITKRTSTSTSTSSEEANVPTMGLGVLSDMRKFFNDLRVNLDSVEEAAALSQEQGFRPGSADPANFLAFLARHGARSNEAASVESGLPRNPTHMRRLMFGYTNDDQPYAHSGLGK